MSLPAQSPGFWAAARRRRLLFFLVAWLIVLMPFLFWRSTWFGRPLTNSELNQYLHDESKPRHIQHALVQIGERISRGQGSEARRWYPELVRLSSHSVEEIRNTDAWVMGLDPSDREFHLSLLRLLHDPSVNVRNNAALSLVRFGDPSAHPQIAAMLNDSAIQAPQAGTVSSLAKAGDPIRAGTMVLEIQAQDGAIQVRSPITGTLTSLRIKKGEKVKSGEEVAVIAPGTEQTWEALRALYLIGTSEDLPAVERYERNGSVAERIRQQARDTARSIRSRAGSASASLPERKADRASPNGRP